MQQQSVRLIQQANTDGQTCFIANFSLCPLKSFQVVGHFFNVICIANGQTRFFIKQVDQSRLGTFHL